VQDLPTCLVIADPVVNLAVHGDALFHQGNYAGAADWFEQAFAMGDAPGWAYLEAACASAMLGKHEQAFNHLYQAVDHGFADPQHLASVECLKPLKDTPEWASLIQKLSEQA
jgi:tetratricopeptide (TPR) repeat protein